MTDQLSRKKVRICEGWASNTGAGSAPSVVKPPQAFAQATSTPAATEGVNVNSFGAQRDGRTIVTPAINNAI